MKRVWGYTLFWFGIGMLMMFIIGGGFLGILLIAGALLLSYLLFSCWERIPPYQNKRTTAPCDGSEIIVFRLSQLYQTWDRKYKHITSVVHRLPCNLHVWCLISRLYWIFYENGWHCFRNVRPFHKLHILPWFCTSLHFPLACLSKLTTVVFYQIQILNARKNYKKMK